MLDRHALLPSRENASRPCFRVSDVPADARRHRLPAGRVLVPGFLDAQVSSAGGVLFNDTPTAKAALAISATVRRTGTTGVLPDSDPAADGKGIL